jgi:hypothetical protein
MPPTGWYEAFATTSAHEVILLGADFGGGFPTNIQVTVYNIEPFVQDPGDPPDSQPVGQIEINGAYSDDTSWLRDPFPSGPYTGLTAAVKQLARQDFGPGPAYTPRTPAYTWYAMWGDPVAAPDAVTVQMKLADGTTPCTWAAYRLRAVVVGGIGRPDEVLHFIVETTYDDPPVDETPDPLDDHIYAPTLLAAEFIPPAGADPAIARLTWTDNADNELGFVIERRELTGDGVWYEMYRPAADVETWDDRAVLPGTIPNPEVQYRVYAYKASLRSTDSNLATLSLVDEVDPPHLAAWATAPIVNPGPAIVVTGPPPATRTTAVTVTRGRLNGDLTYGWAQVSGPVGNATISDATALNTDVVFAGYVPGRYVLEVTVTTEALVGTALVGTGRATFVMAPTRGPIVSGGNTQVTP